ncbi:MAG: T9SS type A sorting domain-containing protein [archaeon]
MGLATKVIAGICILASSALADQHANIDSVVTNSVRPWLQQHEVYLENQNAIWDTTWVPGAVTTNDMQPHNPMRYAWAFLEPAGCALDTNSATFDSLFYETIQNGMENGVGPGRVFIIPTYTMTHAQYVQLAIWIEGEVHYDAADDRQTALPKDLQLNMPYPNPFNASTRISFTANKPTQLDLDVYDITGRKVANLYHGQTPVGTHTILFTPTNAATGMYFVKATTPEQALTQKVLFLK